jgi:hypothetical protein
MLAILIEGPSRVGHYFRPAFRNRAGQGATLGTGSLIYPDGQPHVWSLRYSPKAHDGHGEITVVFDQQTQKLALAPGLKERGAVFDRFGFFNLQSGGHWVEVYLDDLELLNESVAQ